MAKQETVRWFCVEITYNSRKVTIEKRRSEQERDAVASMYQQTFNLEWKNIRKYILDEKREKRE